MVRAVAQQAESVSEGSEEELEIEKSLQRMERFCVRKLSAEEEDQDNSMPEAGTIPHNPFPISSSKKRRVERGTGGGHSGMDGDTEEDPVPQH